jgi:hypothetical protein
MLSHWTLLIFSMPFGTIDLGTAGTGGFVEFGVIATN